MDYSMYAFLLLAIASALLVAEFFIPSAGVLFLMMGTAVGASLYCAYKAWWVESTPFFFGFMLFEVILLPSVALGAIYILPRTAFGKRILLDGPDLDDVNAYKEEEAHFSEMVGQEGEAISRLSPGGMVKIDGERLHCYTEGMIVQKGDMVTVLRVAGARLVVIPSEMIASSPAESESKPGDAVSSDADAETVIQEEGKKTAQDEKPRDEKPQDEKPRLDFDIPGN